MGGVEACAIAPEKRARSGWKRARRFQGPITRSVIRQSRQKGNASVELRTHYETSDKRCRQEGDTAGKSDFCAMFRSNSQSLCPYTVLLRTRAPLAGQNRCTKATASETLPVRCSTWRHSGEWAPKRFFGPF